MGFISEILGYPLGWIMWLIYKMTTSYAWSIVIFTIITKVIFIPLSIKQQKSTAAMSALNPKLDRIKKQYANNQQKQQEETMKLYNEEGVNPMASCLPSVVQLVILYGVFDVVYRPLTHIFHIAKDVMTSAKEITAALVENVEYASIFGQKAASYYKARPEMYVIEAIKSFPEKFSDGQFTELVNQVNGFNYNLFGIVDMGKIPSFTPEVWNIEAIILILIPILSGVFQLAFTIYNQIKQKKLNPDAPSNPTMNSMNIMFYFMPLISIWIGLKFPAGIGFYWMMSSLFSLVQQMVLSNIYTPAYVQKLVEKDKIKNKNKKKSGLAARYEKMMQDAQEYTAQKNGTASTASSERITTSGTVKDENGEEIKLSKSKQKEYERRLINEARKRMAEKYGEDFVEDNSDNDND